MTLSSVSKTVLVLRVNDSTEIQCEVKRHMSPRTVKTILTMLPFKGKAHIFAKAICLHTPVAGRTERPRKEFRRGDIAFLPIKGKMYFFKSHIMLKTPMTPVGRVLSSDGLDAIKTEDVLLFAKK